MLEEFDKISFLDIKSKVQVVKPTAKVIKPKRIFILGPAKSGKDTLAVAISKYVWFGGTAANYTGSTSLAMLPYVYQEALKHSYGSEIGAQLESMSFPEFYERRVECRIFWYNVIKAYRILDPYFIINEEGSDIFVGSRDWGEIQSCVECTQNPYFVLCRSDGSFDPTWPFDYETSRLFIMKQFGVSSSDIVTFDYKESNFELFLSILETAKELGRLQNLRVSFLARDCKFERHGVTFDGVLKGRFY